MSAAILVLAVLAAIAILGAVVVVVIGRAGELSGAEPDYAPLDLPHGPVTGWDLGRLRLPLALWGYHVRAMDELLERVSDTLTSHEDRIAALERRVLELGGPAALADLPPHGQHSAGAVRGHPPGETVSMPDHPIGAETTAPDATAGEPRGETPADTAPPDPGSPAEHPRGPDTRPE